MAKHLKDQTCPVCNTMLSRQGMIGHLRYKHPNYDGRKQPQSVQESPTWKDGFVEGVLAFARKAG